MFTKCFLIFFFLSFSSSATTPEAEALEKIFFEKPTATISGDVVRTSPTYEIGKGDFEYNIKQKTFHFDYISYTNSREVTFDFNPQKGFTGTIDQQKRNTTEVKFFPESELFTSVLTNWAARTWLQSITIKGKFLENESVFDLVFKQGSYLQSASLTFDGKSNLETATLDCTNDEKYIFTVNAPVADKTNNL